MVVKHTLHTIGTLLLLLLLRLHKEEWKELQNLEVLSANSSGASIDNVKQAFWFHHGHLSLSVRVCLERDLSTSQGSEQRCVGCDDKTTSDPNHFLIISLVTSLTYQALPNVTINIIGSQNYALEQTIIDYDYEHESNSYLIQDRDIVVGLEMWPNGSWITGGVIRLVKIMTFTDALNYIVGLSLSGNKLSMEFYDFCWLMHNVRCTNKELQINSVNNSIQQEK